MGILNLIKVIFKLFSISTRSEIHKKELKNLFYKRQQYMRKLLSCLEEEFPHITWSDWSYGANQYYSRIFWRDDNLSNKGYFTIVGYNLQGNIWYTTEKNGKPANELVVHREYSSSFDLPDEKIIIEEPLDDKSISRVMDAMHLLTDYAYKSNILKFDKDVNAAVEHNLNTHHMIKCDFDKIGLIGFKCDCGWASGRVYDRDDLDIIDCRLLWSLPNELLHESDQDDKGIHYKLLQLTKAINNQDQYRKI